jgi:hypothetical protein
MTDTGRSVSSVTPLRPKSRRSSVWTIRAPGAVDLMTGFPSHGARGHQMVQAVATTAGLSLSPEGRSGL